MSHGALTSTGDNLRRLVARAAGTLALGAAGIALGVTLATPAVAVPPSADDHGPLGSSVSDTVEATVGTVRKTTETLATVTDALGLGAADRGTVPDAGKPATEPESGPVSEVSEQAPAPGAVPAPAPADPRPVIEPAEPVEPATQQVAQQVTKPAGPATEPVAKTVEDAVELVSEGVLQPVTDPVRETVTEPVGEAVAGITEKPVAQVAEVVEQVSDPVLKPVTEQAGTAVKPVTEPLGAGLAPVTGLVGQIVSPLEPVLRSVTEPLAPVTGGLLTPVVDVVSPVTGIVGGVTTPIVRVLQPVTAPVTDALAPVLGPVGAIAAPVGEALAPVVEPLAPVPGLALPGILPAGLAPADPAAGQGNPTYPGALQAPGDVAGLVVWTSAARHALPGLSPASGPEVATAVDTVRALSVATTDVVQQDGPGPGAGDPRAAGGVGNAVVAVAGSFLGAGAPQLKPLAGEVLAVLAALLIFQARAWRAATDESRAKLASIYADVPVSPA